MLSVTNLKNAAQAGTYYEKDDYYVKGQSPSMWWGQTAEKLGLEGQVDREEFQGLLEGRLPNGEELRGGQGGERRPGMDLTFSAPKSVSLAVLVGGDARIHQAHQEAVGKALAWLEQNAANARITKEGETRSERTGNLLVARFEHDTSRELDPQLHTHAVVLNVTERSDGELRALDNPQIYSSKMTAGAIYRSELAMRLRDLGYGINLTHADGRFEIEGVGREQIEQFSTRRKQIEEALGERGLSSARAAEVAALDTRKAKQEIDRDQLKLVWKEKAQEAGLDLRIPKARSAGVEKEQESPAAAAKRFAEMAVEHYAERSSLVRQEELLKFALERGTGKTTMDHCLQAIEQMKKKGELLSVGDEHYTTLTAVKFEREILNRVWQGKGTLKPILEPAKLDLELANRIAIETATEKRRGLNPGQAEAVRLILGTSDRVVGIQGYAGTGKTFMLKTVRELAEAAGFEVRGFSNTASATALLEQDSGIKSDTLAKLLLPSRPKKEDEKEKGEEKKPKLWVVDEASMMGTGQAKRLLGLAEKEQARVVLVGDRAQLGSIEAGKPFALLSDRGMECAKMTEIIRQKDQDLKAAVEQVIAGHPTEALQKIERSIIEVPDGDPEDKEENRLKRLAILADRYLESCSAPVDKRPLMITGTNADRRTLNDMVREGLAEKGVLQGEKINSTVLVPKSFTKVETREAQSYQEGDVVRFGRGYKSLEVKAGEYASVTKVDSKNEVVHLRLEDGRELEWKPSKAFKVEAYSKEDRDLKAGDLIRWTRNDKGLGRNNGELAKVLEVDLGKRQATVETSKGKTQVLDLAKERHWEHGYASTIYSAQGKTCDLVLIHINTHQKNVTGQEAWYVAISRGRLAVVVVTNDREQLPEVIQRIMAQKSALEELEQYARKHAEPEKLIELPTPPREGEKVQTIEAQPLVKPVEADKGQTIEAQPPVKPVEADKGQAKGQEHVLERVFDLD